MSIQSLQASLDVTRLDLTELLDNQAATTQDNLGAGRLNVWRNSMPAPGVPINAECDGVALRSVTLTGTTPDNVRCDGQIVAVEPAGRYDWIYLLCTSERRSAASVVCYYRGGLSSEQDLHVSDLWDGAPGHGEILAYRSSAIHYPHHVQRRVGITVWAQRVPVTWRGELTHIRLPRGGAVHLFDAVLVSSWVTPTADVSRGDR